MIEMSSFHDYGTLAVKVLLWSGGAASTLVGAWLTSWLSSKTHSYHDALNKHRDELKEKVLEPLRRAIESGYSNPSFSVEWQAKPYKSSASLAEMPVEFGPALSWSDLGKGIEDKLEQALLEDARITHHPELFSDWIKFRDSWSSHVARRVEWVQHMSEEILRWSILPAHPAPEPSGPYVMHLNLAKFIYHWFLQIPTGNLHIEAETNGAAILSDGSTSYAKGPGQKIDGLLQFLNSLVEINKVKASEFAQQLEKLQL
ncbi:MAG TPA: hypothetical protein VG759_01245, partial [Candidatus Angelobacter sp.]|nr:hypothetical protein [Candidatus Angelobacter sp.]